MKSYLQMFKTGSVVLFLAIIACINCQDNDTETIRNETENTNKNASGSIDSRFFDLGSMFNEMLPGIFNQGNHQGGSTAGYPGNSQMFPATPQGQIQTPQGNGWPIIDDAKQFPSQGNNGNYQNQYPNQGNFGGSQQQTQYPNQGNFGGSQQTQYPGQGGGGAQQMQYPNQGNFGRPQQVQYPNQGNFGGLQQAQYPGQGNFGGSQQTQYPGPRNFGGSQQTQYPGQGNFGGTNVNTGSPQQMQYPNQGGFLNQGNQNGYDEEGTLYGILSTQKPPITGIQNGRNPQSGNGSATKPVVIPTTTSAPGQIVFPEDSTDSPSQRQCVQDCSTTSEYSPVCGSNNVTYFNPGRFICARNCGINVFVKREGKCDLNSPL